jgi:hypothetical protein
MSPTTKAIHPRVLYLRNERKKPVPSNVKYKHVTIQYPENKLNFSKLFTIFESVLETKD